MSSIKEWFLKEILRTLHRVVGLRRRLAITHCGYRVLLDPDDHCGRQIYIRYLRSGRWRHEEFEKNVVQKIININTNLWFIDVGASYGMYSLLAATNVSSGRVERVVSIEGCPRTFSWLEENINSNHLANIVHAYNLVITDIDDKELAFFRHPRCSEWSRIAGDAEQQTADAQMVPSKTLDSLLVAEGWTPDKELLIKIDIEGGEPRALSGLAKTLTAVRNYFVIAEFHVPLLDRIDGNAIEFAKQILAMKPEVIYELSEGGKFLREISGEDDFRALIDRCRKGRGLGQIMTNVVFGSKRLRTLDEIAYEKGWGNVKVQQQTECP